MNQFDQYNAMMSLEQALVPTAGLVDSRTEADNLRLLVDIASLFNFYDRTNTINGNWSPFLLKDPVFLVASIAKTSFQKAYSLFINTCLQLEVALNKKTNDTFISNAFNQLFDQLTFIFKTIERWTYYMQQSSLEYNLKTYIIQQVKEKQSALLWALLALKNDLTTNDIIPNIRPVDTFAYENYDKKIWKESKGKRPYWELLNLKYSPQTDYVYYFFKDFIALIKKIETLLNGSFSEILKEIFTIAEDAYTALVKAIDIFFSVSESLVKKVTEFIEEIAGFVHQVIHKIRDELEVKLESIKDEDTSETIDAILSEFDALQDTIKEIDDEHSYEDLKGIVIKILKAIKAIVIKITVMLLKFGTSIFDIIKEIFKAIANTFKKIGEELYAKLNELLKHILEKQVRQDIYNGIKGTGKTVFAFYSNCISYAETELESVQNVPGHFPDTILLRTFTSLLKIYQTQLNSLSEKHLNFYYGDILKQLPNSVSPDTVFACSDLAKKTATFQLPKSTVFTAGLDANKQAILFETTSKVSLNPAKIANAYTLAIGNADKKMYLQELPPVTAVKKDESGNIQQWKTFGSENTPIGTKEDLAIAFASPLFFLAEAKTRTIKLTFTLSDSNTSDLSTDNTTCYLSTAKAWFPILKKNSPITQDGSTVTLTITLCQTDPAITAFTKNPDGYTSDWPLLKLVFSNNQNLQNPTEIETLNIDVDVKELQNFALYNDFGLLNAKKPFQPLGPTPTVDQSFMIGSAEIFSKPTNSITITMNWNPFPADFNFAVYYKEYNDFLNDVYSKEPKDLVAARELLEKVLDLENSFFNKITETQEALFKSLFDTTKTDASKLITEADSKLKKAIEAQNEALVKEIDPKNATIKKVITLHNILLSYIITEEATLLKEVGTDGNLDAKKITETEQVVLSKIISTKNSIILQLTAAESSLSKAPPLKTKSVFKNAIDSIFNRHTTTPTTLLEDDTSGDTTEFQFSNDSFEVNFKWLQNGLWEEFYTNQEPEEVLISSESKLNLFFPTEPTGIEIPDTRAFTFPGLNVNIIEVDPALQKTPLTLTDKSSTGFLKMQLVTPDDGFGLNLYPKIIGAIALFNARLIMEKSSESLVNPPNLPFIPTVSLFSGDYNASINYDFSTNDETYPLECFYYTPFLNYKVFDTVDGISTKNTTIGSSPARDDSGIITPLTALPLVATFVSNGQLFLELADVIAPAKVSFYFELARTYTEQAVTTNSVSYSYLSTDGWKALTSIADGTNGFTCSGIITINIPKDITNDHETMTGTNFWIAMGTETSPDNFPQTSFLKTNGITLQRIVSSNDFSTVTPQIIADTITSPETAIPEISATIQPFASFGGKAAETNQQMNSRVSTRLKTKDRLVTAEDYFNVIRLEFPEVYYSKTMYTAKKASTYVIKRVSDATETNAFVPLLSECKELEIQNYIKERISPFVKVSVGNFKLNYVLIIADIQLQSDEDVTTVTKEINNAINIYLAPWITSAQSQITVDTGLNTAQLASFINSYDSVLEVNSISIQIVTENFNPKEIKPEDGKQEISQEDGMILVPSLNNITENSFINYHL
ncbi:hypothetical protein H2O64_06640 [Kordia sp. YSTF-M3]|uniref:Baseplate protein J-like domain-containing protein n=1 Tax=Kordia aestuariivivens TaxID=2759037 RepID=A0ABR7Q7K9_9FLAO|nr:hypothetical protein [Kordia aestuariivivens]MBC8754341.1 hypothetical protein [Kordia aestuariivivens]